MSLIYISAKAPQQFSILRVWGGGWDRGVALIQAMWPPWSCTSYLACAGLISKSALAPARLLRPPMLGWIGCRPASRPAPAQFRIGHPKVSRRFASLGENVHRVTAGAGKARHQGPCADVELPIGAPASVLGADRQCNPIALALCPLQDCALTQLNKNSIISSYTQDHLDLWRERDLWRATS